MEGRKMVERYGGLAGGIVPADDGPWVRYSDYMVMEADRDFWKERLQVETRARIEAETRLEEAMKALEPFAAIEWADEDGWSHDSPYRDRVCDWFGPSDFRTARRVREGGKVE